jgi:hypothetical protein
MREELLLPFELMPYESVRSAKLSSLAPYQVPFSPWQTRETVVCLDIRGDAVADVDGNTFPNTTVCKAADHRC